MRLRLAYDSPWLFVAALASSGCVEDVQLASDCTDPRMPCVELDEPSDVRPDPGADPDEPDAGAPAAPDAEAAPDVPDAAVGVMPDIRNPSFEFSRADGVAGEVTTVGGLLSPIAPWFTCQPIGAGTSSVTAVRAEIGLDAGTLEGAPKVDVKATNGQVFLTMGYLIDLVPMPLLQRLEQPLQAGQRYAFALDLLTTSPEAGLAFEVRGNEDSCLGTATPTTLAISAPIVSTTWQTVCVSFTSPSELPYLILAVARDPQLGLELLDGPRLFYDNLRPATPTECPTP